MERLWVTQQSVAWRIAASLGRQAALPVMTGTARVKRSVPAGVQVGDLVALTHTAAGISALKVRIAELTVDKPDSPEVAIRWKEDRGWLNAIPTAVAPRMTWNRRASTPPSRSKECEWGMANRE